ncbi:alpha/beta hydrolase fold domain-containing protein [Pseudoroseicyclus tamaricis]|uniref:Alpha/beta hydrolase n=1 Tax=Pseudoroseicyclus tamaricis TaxID=2705421 RepID=A0A6B2JG43_9RHOB|nr:alpha/beta hydrolase [Pseudoroseicyclus tamaricis]NDV00111.1 alpha/beta hydrolase [Pseudoroseicyclus tamaricis]
MSPSWQLRLVMAGLRLGVRPAITLAPSPTLLRAGFWLGSRILLQAPSGAAPRPIGFRGAEGRLEALWLGQRPEPGLPVTLYLHGGGYIAGSPQTHWKMAARLARAMPVFLPAYRLAPEHPAPAAFDDARAAFAHLVAAGHAPGDIRLAGDSAGGGLALALMAALAEEGTPPAAVAAFSPMTDLTFSGTALRENAARDPMFPAARAAELGAMILGEGPGALPATDPRLSPLYATFAAPPPPVAIWTSDWDLMRDDGLRMAARLREAGGAVALRVARARPHDWAWFGDLVPEAMETLAEARAFLLEPRQVVRSAGES